MRCIRLTGLPEKPHLTALCARDRTNPLAESFLKGLPEDVPLIPFSAESGLGREALLGIILKVAGE